MVCKRPFGDEESYELANKHPRQLEYSNQLASFVKFVPCNDVSQEPHTSAGEGEVGFSRSQGEERIVSDKVTEISVGADKEFETSALGSISSLLWVTSSTNEEDNKSEAALRVSFSPVFFEPDHTTRTLVQPEEIYSSLLDYPHRKLVSVGPDHQADVPVWGLKGMMNASDCLDASDPHIAFPGCLGSDLMVDDKNREKLMGTCVISMTDSDLSAYNGDKVVHGRADCSCPDGGSVRCVRQHITEAREKLRGTLGQETFVELGFCEMGEEVARKWSEEEEQIFHEVVFSNPASSGRNFWDHLSVVFPSRTRKDLVSYYFNVFILRKRAEQNRVDPQNIDSDNDEWQCSEGDDEFGMTEEDEDSVVESPADRNSPVYNEEHEEHFHEDDEGGDETYGNHEEGDLGDDGGIAGEEDEGGLDDVSDGHYGKLPGYFSYDSKVRLAGKNPQNGGEDQDVQDDSCTSYECQPNRADSCGPAEAGTETQDSRGESDHSENLQGSYDGLSSGVDHGYVLEPCDTKVWDVGYLTGTKNDVDFLPTCSMIEEVFGEEDWHNKGRDGKGIS